MRSLRLHPFLLAVLLPLGAAAQTPDTVVVLPEVHVEAAREAARHAGRRVTRLDAEALTATGARTAADLLDARTGLVFRRYGDGGLATAALRGAGAAQTLVLLDGLRLSDPQTGAVDLSLVPALLLDAAEVVHGPASARYGSGGLGGVVRLHTRRPGAGAPLAASGTIGAFGERRASLVAAGGRGRLSALGAAEVGRRTGDFTYRNEALVPARAVRREGADAATQTAFGRVQWAGDGRSLSLAAWAIHAGRGLPGPGNAPPGGARQTDDQVRLWLGGTSRARAGSLRFQALVQQAAQRFINPADGTDRTTRTRTVALDAQRTVLLGPRWLLDAGAEAGLDRAGDARQGRVAAFALATGALGPWVVEPALRVDTYRIAGRTTLALSPHLGASLQPARRPGLLLKLSAGRSFRAPTFNERFWQPGGNPDLKAEHGWSAEVGVQGPPPGRAGTSVEVTAFAARLDDQIVWQPGLVAAGVQVWRPANVARVVTRGVEASVQRRAQRGRWRLDGGAFVTFTDARNRANPDAPSFGRQLRYVPHRQLKLFAGLGRGALRLDLHARAAGRRYLASDESAWLDPYLVLDAQLRAERRIGPARCALAVGLANVLDADYEIIRRYPMPPRHARLRLTVAL